MNWHMSIVNLCVLFFIWSISFHPVYSVGLGHWEKMVNAARCRVRCLDNLQDTEEFDLLSKVKPLSSLVRCIEDRNCTACLKPCSQPFVTLQLCQKVCENEADACLLSCRFLKQINTVRPGECSNENDASGTSSISTCEDTCEDDLDCGVGLKCCSSQCGDVCQEPINAHVGMPDIPAVPTIRERPKGGSIELKWDEVHRNISGPVLYVIENRYNIGKHHSESHSSPWQQIAQTTGSSTVFRDVIPGHWYQFRVTAVNVFGSKRASDYTTAFCLSKEPRPPTAPQNLKEGETYIMDGKIGVTVHWFPPRKTDLPVTRYKVFWSKRITGVSSQSGSFREHRQVLSGTQLEYEIPDLEPDTSYFVQVQAICHYGDDRLKSERASLSITTFPLPEDSSENREPPEVDVLPLPTPSPLEQLQLNSIFFQNGLLKGNISWEFPPDNTNNADIDKVLIYWTPEVCIAVEDVETGLSKTMSATSQEHFFVIYDLRFDCRYIIKVQAVSTEGMLGPLTETSFPTPSCSDVLVIGNSEPDCPTNVPRVPESPPDFQDSFVISNSNVSTKLSWATPESDMPVTGYRLMWGQALEDGEHHPAMDKTTALTKVLSKNINTFNLGNLIESTTYVAHIQALSRTGAGRLSSLYFTTPMLQMAPRDPPYRQISDDNSKRDGGGSKHEDDNMMEPSIEVLNKGGGGGGGGSNLVPSSSSTPQSPAKHIVKTTPSDSINKYNNPAVICCSYLSLHLLCLLTLCVAIVTRYSWL